MSKSSCLIAKVAAFVSTDFRCPSIAGKPAMMMVAGILSVFVLLLKSRFFGVYVNGVTLADGKEPPLCKGRWHGASRDGGIVILR